jgi:hypothetical protein
VIDVCFIVASCVSLAWHRLPELHYEKRAANALWCTTLFTLGNVSLRKVLPVTKLWSVFVYMVTSSKPEHIGVRVAKQAPTEKLLNLRKVLDTDLFRLRIYHGIFYFS